MRRRRSDLVDLRGNLAEGALDTGRVLELKHHRARIWRDLAVFKRFGSKKLAQSRETISEFA